MTRFSLPKAFPFFLSAIIVILYSNSLSFNFIDFWDNQGFSYIKGNELITSLSFDNIKTIFTSSFDHHYHPLTLISLAIDYQIGGDSPLVFRITNLILFVFIAWFIFIFVNQLTKNFYLSAFVSLFFALHPFNVESIAWLSERKNLLFAFFWFPSVILYLKYQRVNKLKFLYFSALLFFISLLTKSQGLTLVPVLFLIDYFEGKPLDRKSLLNKIPFLLLAGVFTLFVLMFHNPEIFTRNHPASPIDYFFTGFRNLAFFTYKTFVPYGFSAYYPYPDYPSLINVFWYFPLLVIAFSIIIYKYFRHDKLMIFGLAFFIFNIFPMLKCFSIPYGNFIAADRYMILPISGLAIFAWALASHIKIKKKIAPAIVVSLFFVFLFYTSWNYSLVWKDNISFYTGLIDKHPELQSAWGNRGKTYMSQKKYNEAVSDFTELIHLNPDYSNAYLNRGLAYINLNKEMQAYNDFSSAIRCDSQNFKAYNNRALLLLRTGKLDQALIDADKGVELQPNSADAWYNKSLILFAMGQDSLCLTGLDNAYKFGFSPMEKLNGLRNEVKKRSASISGS